MTTEGRDDAAGLDDGGRDHKPKDARNAEEKTRKHSALELPEKSNP